MKAAELAYNRNTPTREHAGNGDEDRPSKLMSFTKGLPHNYETGLVESLVDFDLFVKGIDSGDPQDFISTPLGFDPVNWRSRKGIESNADVRAWESAGAGHTFDLQGPDAQSVGMPPPPPLGSDELIAEIAEVYCQALLRDVPFSVLYNHVISDMALTEKAEGCVAALNQLSFIQQGGRGHAGHLLSLHTAFRGFAKGDMAGPYLSQFLLSGNNGINGRDRRPEFPASQGYINYGSITIDQRVRRARPINYMTKWDEYIDVQNGADFRGMEEYVGKERRFITTGRDLATYVHYDALYEAYLNACLLLLAATLESHDENITKFDRGVPFQRRDFYDKQEGFAHYGGPHILTLVTEAATRALKAVRYQKFNIHRRLRPEAFAARLEKLDRIKNRLAPDSRYKLEKTSRELEQAGIFQLLRKENEGNLLLPMAFCEGSPMHPSYGAGHATVAGACVTVLKAFFNHELYLNISPDGTTCKLSTIPGGYAFLPDDSGLTLQTVSSEPLTVEGELNKLAANISIGRDWAGVHYYSDYKESLLMGEEIAIGILEEQALTYNPREKFFLTLPKFDGSTIRIENKVHQAVGV